MIVRPEGEPPLNYDDPTKPVGGSYRWDFISRYINGFRLQLGAEGKDGYHAQLQQHLSAEAARYQRFIADGTAGAPPISSVPAPAAEQADLHIRDFRSRVEFMAQSQGTWTAPFLLPVCGPQGAEHLAALASGRGVQGAEHLAAPRVGSADTAASLAAAAAAFGLDGSFRPPSQPPTRASPGPHPSLALFPQAVERPQHAGIVPGPPPPYPPPLMQLVLGVASLTLVPRSRQFILPTEGKRLECGCLLPTLRGQSIPPPLLLAAAVLADASSPRFSSLVIRIRLGRGERSGSDCRAPICRLSFQSLHRHLHHRPHRQSECRSPGQLSGITVWWSSNWSSAGRTAAVVVCPIVRNASDASRGPRAAVKITSVVGAAHPPSLSSARVPPRQMARLGRGS